jgi:hypothetical protein
MHRQGADNGGIAISDDGADFGAAGAGRRAVAAMDESVAVAGLAAAFLLKCNPRLDFRTHSNHRNRSPLPPWEAGLPHAPS